jgi:DGQHR domain-containing protein
VNLEQTKVHKSLVYDLFSLARTRSPQKTCHNIAVALDRDKDGPLFKRIKRLGFATEGRLFEPITQATFVEALLPYLSDAPKKDRDILLKGGTIQKIYGSDLFKLPFRNMFIDKMDIEIAAIISNYFYAIRQRWPTAWEERGRGMVLNRTNGFRALMRFLRNAYLDVGVPGDIPAAQKFLERVFRKIELEDQDFTTENFVPGTSGEARLYRVLRGQEQI